MYDAPIRSPGFLIGLLILTAATPCWVSCNDASTVEVGDTVTLNSGGIGVIQYAKVIRRVGLEDTTELRPVRRAQVDVRDEDGFLVASMFTNELGEFEYPENAGLLKVTVRAFSRGPRVHTGVYRAAEDPNPWSVTGVIGEVSELVISEAYAAGAFNVIDLAIQAGDAIEGLVSDAPAPELRVIWNETAFPVCGACFYFSTFRLELTGAPGDVDAHDDDVVLHELGHYLEAAYGVYGNPGGFHEVAQRVNPQLAWSEGFATWFSGWIRKSPDYIDIQPNDTVYALNLETLEQVITGVSFENDPQSDYSEGIVYGVMWDLFDSPVNDDDGVTYNALTILSAALDPQAVLDSNGTGPDFVDWLTSWQCTVPSAAEDIGLLTEAVGFPYDVETAKALCAP